MGLGIHICGLNGCGKSTLGKALAERMGCYFFDNEYLYFSGSNADEPYVNPKSHAEVEFLLMDEITKHPDFVYSAVKGDYGTEIVAMYNYVVVIDVPKEIRIQRVRNRSFQKFGDRMLIGGDLYEQEEAFFQKVEAREENYIENWLRKLNCPIIRIDGTKPIEENVEYIIQIIYLNA